MLRILQYEKFKGLSEAQQRDFDFYFNFGTNKAECAWMDCFTGLTFFPPVKPEKIYPYFVSKEHWYYLFDTFGICALHEPWQDCYKLISGKMGVNITIEQWVESVLEESAYVWEVWEWCHEMPDWVWKSFERQLNKHKSWQTVKKISYSPDGKVYWPPWQINFDPSI